MDISKCLNNGSENPLDYIIRNNPDDFKMIGFIGTQVKNYKEI